MVNVRKVLVYDKYSFPLMSTAIRTFARNDITIYNSAILKNIGRTFIDTDLPMFY